MKIFTFQIVIIVALLSAFCYPAVAQQNTLSSSARYQIFFNPNIRADTFLVDTSTGKVWRLTTFMDVENEPTVWSVIDRIDDDKQLLNYLRSHKLKRATDSTQNKQ